jgi:hypothetical protein
MSGVMKQTHENGGLRLQAPLRLSIFWLLFGSLVLCGQSLRVSSIRGSPGETIGIEISLDAPTGKAPASLKWETVFPAQLLQAEGNGPSPGSAANESGKSLTCATPKAYSYVCILAGGEKPVGNGPIATFRFKIRDEARIGAATITVDHVEGVSGDAAPMTLGDAAGLVTIWSLHGATLNWVASTSSGVIGYNIYRSTTSGGPYTKVNSTPTSGTHYTDSGVQAGQTYYYVTTSVDLRSNESEYSEQVEVTIPTP